MSRYVRVRNWEKFQQYKDRRPTWIKAYIGLLDNYEYGKLPDSAKGHLHGIWLLAAATSNKIPADPAWIASRIGATSKIDLDSLISFGFLEYAPGSAPVQNRTDDQTVAVRRQPELCSLEKSREEKSREENTSVAVAPGTWSKEACDDWIKAFNGTAPGGQIGKALKPLIADHGWAEVRPAWQSYLSQSEAQYASASRFAATYGRWNGNATPAVGKETLEQHNRRVLSEYKRPGEA